MKKIISLAAAVFLIMNCLSAGVFAADSGSISIDAGTGMGAAFNEDGMPISGTVYSCGTLEGILPDQTIYLKIKGAELLKSSDAAAGAVINDSNILSDKDVFRLKVKKDGDGKSLIQEVSQVSEKKDANGNRCGWLKIVLAPSDETEEQKAELHLTLTAKDDDAAGGWAKGDYASVDLNLWIENPAEDGDSYEAQPGDDLVYQPVSNENNELTWDSIATLMFTADDDASKFYAKLSTKADETVYSRFPDAELFFRDFSGTPNISAVSRATLTLLNPWAEDDNTLINPKNCYIYTKDSEGELSDVTSLFTFLEADEEGNEVNGWRIKTRMLGSYVISDVPLDTASESEQFLMKPETVDFATNAQDIDLDPITNNTKPNPPTGRCD